MGTDARVIPNSNFTKDTGYTERRELGTILNGNQHRSVKTSDTYQIVIRHHLGENCSYFWNKMLIQLLVNLQNSVDFITEYDDTTISVRLKVK